MKTSLLVACLSIVLLDLGSAGEPGKMSREVWKDVKGSGTWHLKNDPKFQKDANIVEAIDGIEPPADWGDDYGQRLRGYLKVPESGSYRLLVAGDDNCELWLGEGQSKFRTRKVAWIVGVGWGHSRDWSGFRQWRKIPTQQSAPIELKAGEKYFIEVLHKEGNGGDHLSVGWLKPNKVEIEVIPASALEAYAPNEDSEDVDGDDLADAWEEANGINPRDDGRNGSSFGAFGDPDGDGLANWEEQKHQTDPRSDLGRPGYLQRDIWYGVWGRTIENLMNHPGFYRRADRRDVVEGASTTTDDGDQCGVRLRGFIKPPRDGEYEFWIAGDDHCELWLSGSESKFGIRRLAAIDGGPGFVRPDEWDKLPGQRSEPVNLQSGKRYYVEILLKEGWWQDFVSVAWRSPGGEREVIPAVCFESYVPSTEDRDDDGLPGEWEQSFGFDPSDAEGDHGALGDPDGDFIPNILEYREGYSPVVANSLWGAVTLDVWNGLGGVRVSDLVGSRDFLDRPNSTGLEYGGLELPGRGDRYGLRARFRIKVPESGSFRFWIAGDDNCELWLSENETKFFKRKIAWVMGPGTGNSGDWVEPKCWDWQASQASQGIPLEAGHEYFMEILLKEGVGNDHVEVAWKGPGVPEIAVVPDTAVSSYTPEASDVDDDYLPDEWEASKGLSATDNGFIDGAREGEFGDHDWDRLDNRAEFLMGTDPCSPDSDGDGVSDYEELKVYGSDPARADASPPVVVATLPLGGQIKGGMRWTLTPEGAMISLERRGETKWQFEVAQPGVYQIDLTGWSVGASAQVPSVPVSVAVDGVKVGGDAVYAGPPATSLSYMTRWLAAGSHELSVYNHNLRTGVSLVIQSVEILAQTGDDHDSNSLPDWLESYYRNLNRASVPQGASMTTSPVCLEGSARFHEDLRITVGGEQLAPFRALRGKWFANIPLANDGSPLEVDLSYEGGSLSEKVQLAWRETNLLDGTEVYKVRKGDAMRLTAYEAGSGPQGATFKILADGEQLHEGPAAHPHVFRFTEEGTLATTVEVTEASGAVYSASVKFEVVDADLGSDYHVPSNLSRRWTPPKLPDCTLIEADDNLSITELERGADKNRSFVASFSVTKGTSARVVARLPEGGAILDAATIHGFFIAPSTWTGDHHIIRTLADGTRVVRVSYVIDGLIPPDLSIWIQMYVPDAVFSNGSSWLRLAAADFDANGRADFDIHKAPGTDIPYVCHWIRPFSDGPGEMDEDGPTSSTTPAEQE